MRFCLAILISAALEAWAGVPRTGRFEIFEAAFPAAGNPANPYTAVTAEAILTRPDGGTWRIPLFWDGGRQWKLRVSPDLEGAWRFAIRSADAGLDGRKGRFECVMSSRAGGLIAAGPHFARQNGARVWFLGDTAWGYFTDSPEDNHHRAQAEDYVRRRVGGGFSAIHAMLLSEQGTGNQAGPPFDDIRAERLNPAYWREVDERLAFANRQGLTVGLALAWGDKRGKEPFAWGRFPSREARLRYARYIGARYGAYDVYFLLSGEWHAEISKRGGDAEGVFHEFVEIGDALAAADPHRRLAGIHPMTHHGSVREFAGARWMGFGDYQQNYNALHARALLSRYSGKPVVNGEYGYFLRDQDGDGVPDKSNSYSAEDMRFATWDIAMAGAYVVTGFGTTYFAGHRDPGPFDPAAAKNREWELQAAHVRKFFESLDYEELIPADDLLTCSEARQTDRRASPGDSVRPPAKTWWAMAAAGRTYIIYVRGTTAELSLAFDSRPHRYRIRQFDPRTGEFTVLGAIDGRGVFRYRAPDAGDWAVVLDSPEGSQ
jgi:hypothetical protein